MAKTRAAFIWAALLLATSHAPGADLPPRIRSAALLETIATQGEHCGLLRPWQALALRAANLNDVRPLTGEACMQLIEAAETQIASTPCDAPALTTWIEGAARGFEQEMLPPYLIAYLTLVGREGPPQVFGQATARLRCRSAVQRIRDEPSESSRPNTIEIQPSTRACARLRLTVSLRNQLSL
ncbi:MAG: hypothetical protein AAGA68_23120 [Pseudomonadota bacterium]